jgi:long-chain acyl-CoA synthetase
MDLYQLLEEKALLYPRRKAIIFNREKISYRELKEKIDSFARFLFWEKEIKRGDKVALLLKNSSSFIIVYFAILKIGAVVVPLNIFLRAEELVYILNDSRAIFLISEREGFGPLLEKIKSQAINLRGSSFIEDITPGENKTLPKEGIYSEEAAAILYTSGTTGHPKGVVLTHNNFIANINSCVKAVPVQCKDNFLCFLPMFHSFAWMVCVLVPFSVGASIIVLSSVRPIKKFFITIFKKRVTVFVGIPALYNLLVKIPFFSILSFLIPVRICISGADSLSDEVLAKFEKKFRRPLLEGYGLTEASPVVSFNPLEKRKTGTVGLPLPGIKVKIIDDQGNNLPPGESGELLVQGGNVMKGYYDLPTATEEVIVDGWLYTGDMAYKDTEGYIKIVGRRKDLIINKGLNIYPREIELILESHPDILEAAVVGVRIKAKGEVPKAYIVLNKGTVVKKSEIIRYCRKRLAKYKIPHKIEFREGFSKTSTGKIQKNKLKQENGLI